MGTKVNIGFPVGLLFGMLGKLVEPRERLEKEQLFSGVKALLGKNVMETLSSLPKESQGEIWRQLFTYKPSPLRRLIRGESNKTLMWPGSEDVVNIPKEEGLDDTFPYTTKENVHFTPPSPTMKERHPSLIELDKARTELAKKRTGLLGAEKEETPLQETRKKYLEKRIEKMGEIPEKFVRPDAVSTKTGQPIGEAEKKPWRPMTREEAVSFKKETQKSEKSQEEKDEALRRSLEIKEEFKKETSPVSLQKEDALKQELLLRYSRFPTFWKDETTWQRVQADIQSGNVKWENLPSFLEPKRKERFDKTIQQAAKYAKTMSTTAALLQALKDFYVSNQGVSAHPPIREKNIQSPEVIRYDAQGRQLQ